MEATGEQGNISSAFLRCGPLPSSPRARISGSPRRMESNTPPVRDGGEIKKSFWNEWTECFFQPTPIHEHHLGIPTVFSTSFCPWLSVSWSLNTRPCSGRGNGGGSKTLLKTCAEIWNELAARSVFSGDGRVSKWRQARSMQRGRRASSTFYPTLVLSQHWATRPHSKKVPLFEPRLILGRQTCENRCVSHVHGFQRGLPANQQDHVRELTW